MKKSKGFSALSARFIQQSQARIRAFCNEVPPTRRSSVVFIAISIATIICVSSLVCSLAGIHKSQVPEIRHIEPIEVIIPNVDSICQINKR